MNLDWEAPLHLPLLLPQLLSQTCLTSSSPLPAAAQLHRIWLICKLQRLPSPVAHASSLFSALRTFNPTSCVEGQRSQHFHLRPSASFCFFSFWFCRQQHPGFGLGGVPAPVRGCAHREGGARHSLTGSSGRIDRRGDQSGIRGGGFGGSQLLGKPPNLPTRPPTNTQIHI